MADVVAALADEAVQIVTQVVMNGPFQIIFFPPLIKI
jgi:hypothetical protein